MLIEVQKKPDLPYLKAADSCHAYYPNGEPCYQVMGTKGKMVNTNVGHMKKLGLYPSVTTIPKILASFGLSYYEKQHVAFAALKYNPEHFDTEKEWLNAVFKEGKRHAAEAAESGEVIHGVIETFFNTGKKPKPFKTMLDQVESIVKEYCDHKDCIAEKSFANNAFGYGGKCDLHCVEPAVVFDWKTKERVAEKTIAKLRHADQSWQLSACANGLGIPRAKLVNVYIDRDNPSDVTYYEWPEPSEVYFDTFLAIFDLWKVLNFDPLNPITD